MIVKIQRPLYASDNVPMLALVYNQSRSYTVYVNMADVKHLFKGGEEKVYCKAKRSKTTGIEVLSANAANTVLLDIATGDTQTEFDDEKSRLALGKRLHDQSW